MLNVKNSKSTMQKYKGSKLQTVSLPPSVFFSFSFTFFSFYFLCTFSSNFLFLFLFIYCSLKNQCIGLTHHFKNIGLKNLFLLHKKLSAASQKLQWRQQKFVYVNNQKYVGRANGILACYTELYTPYDHYICFGHLTLCPKHTR